MILMGIISKCLSEILKKRNKKLAATEGGLSSLLLKLNSSVESINLIPSILILAKNKEIHCTSRLVEMLDGYSANLNKGNPLSNNSFPIYEISALEESKGIHVNNFLIPGVFLSMLQKWVDTIFTMLKTFMDNM